MLSNYPEILAFTFAGPNTYQPAIKNLAQGIPPLDASLVREFSILERFRLQFRADAYNLTNTPHFAAPNGSITSSGFGQITATVSNRLGAKLSF